MLKKLQLLKGTLICVPVVNIYGFENHSRYLPDRRDLNRSFPGSGSSTSAGRLANVIFEEIIKKSDYGLDLHSAGTRRTNFPQIRANMEDESIRKIAEAFGCELLVHNKGPSDSLRATASNQGCPTILYEAGETLKFEPGTIKLGVRGVMNVLKTLGMLKGKTMKPIYQTVIRKTSWVRSDNGGLLKFYVKPGDLVKKGKKIVTCHKLFSKESEVLRAPMDGIVLGMTTLPAVKPGEPICHIAKPDISIQQIEKQMQKSSTTLHRRIEKELATSFVIEEE
ncbi:MAG: putative deacylase [Candidatus Omnitrophota bacterium]|jgi:predicted deacylase